ncbi:ComEA family DNA-binding protein [Paenibacillus massiliensis]|uniref:ComEA family DNA-binding protein n=1 Tax=Paenibacillus massiliensis TaxID=225917 RepID=UPI00035FBAE6|nr:helix-hairpin-helix domain-containing protein [Paenibacillus massiliensis]
MTGLKRGTTLAAAVLAVLGSGFILFSGGEKPHEEVWKPLNQQLERQLEQSSDNGLPVAEARSLSQNSSVTPSVTSTMNTAEEQIEPKAQEANNSDKGEHPTPSIIVGEAAGAKEAVQNTATITETSPTELGVNVIADGKINVNTASLAQLMELPGIGEKKAQAIMDYRTQHGAFRQVEDLENVKGIGPKMLEKMKPYVGL